MHVNVCLIKGGNSKSLFVVFSMAFVICVTILARSPVMMYLGEEPVGYRGPASFSESYIQNTGHIIEEGDLSAPTPYSGSIFYSEVNPLFSVRPAMYSIVLGDVASFSDSLLTSLFTTTAFVLVLAANILSAGLWGPSLRLLPGAALVMLIAFGDVSVFSAFFGSNLAFEFILILLCLRLITSPRLTRPRMISLILMSFVLPLFHFTAGATYLPFVLGILVTTALFIRASDRSTLENRDQFRRIQSYTVMYGFFYLSYLIVLSPSSFGPYVGFLYGNVLSDSPRSSVLESVLAPSSSDFFVLHGASMLLYLIPTILLFVLLLSQVSKYRTAFIVVLCMFIPLAFMAVGFLIWMGIMGVYQRISLYVVYPVSTTARYWHQFFRHYRVALAAVVVISLPLSLYTYTQSPYNTGGYAVCQEEELGRWIVMTTYDEQVVVTDLRLSGPLINHGHFYVVGFVDTGSAATSLPYVLDSLFYHISSESFGAGIGVIEEQNNMSIDFIFVSSRMSMDYPGIRGYDFTFRPAVDDFMSEYDKIPSIDLVCDTGVARLYAA